MKPLIPAEVEMSALPIPVPDKKLSLIEKFSWLGTPPGVVSLIKTVDGWMARAQAGAMNSTRDLSLHFGGMSGDYPHVHQDLITTTNFLKSRPMDLDRREMLTDYIRKGLRGLNVFVLAREKDPTAIYNYNGCVNTLKHVAFAVKNSDATKIGNGSATELLDEAVTRELAPMLKRIVQRQSEDGYHQHIPYLLDTLGSICLADGQYTPLFQEEMRTVFKDIYGAFDHEERAYLTSHLEGLHFSDVMVDMTRGLIAEVEVREVQDAGLISDKKADVPLLAQ